jgi:hypothetical protein
MSNLSESAPEAHPDRGQEIPEADLAALRSRRLRRAEIFFVLGILAAYVSTAIQVVFRGWTLLPLILFNLVWLPILAASFGFGTFREPRGRRLPPGRLRIHMRTLMILVAYAALLVGMLVLSMPIALRAGQFGTRANSSESLAETFRGVVAKAEVEAPLRLGNAASLRAGGIPEGLTTEQKEFLRSLEGTATPEYRAYRYGLIADGEERVGKMQERNAVIFRGMVAYHEMLAAKYRTAARRPWLPVEPDPPMPATK